MSEPAWIRRFRAARTSFPRWALEAPSRCAYATNASGVWQLVSWDLDTGVHTRLTDKPTGVTGGHPTPDGTGVVWFDDHAGDEVGRYVVTPFAGGPPRPLLPELEEGWSAGLSLRPARMAAGVADDRGFRLVTAAPGAAPGLVYRHERPAHVAGLSRDGALLAVSHTEHGDVLHPSLRVLDAASGEPLADLHHDGVSVAAAGWSPLPGDQRLAVLTDRTGTTRPEVWTPGRGEPVPLSLDLPGEVWVADWYPDARALLLAHDHLGRTGLLRYDLDQHAATPLELPEGTVRAAAVRADGQVWYAFTSSALPPQVRARRGRDDDPLLTPPGAPAPAGAAYTSLHYPNGEGAQVHAFLATPAADPPWPLVVDAHGGPHAQSEDTFAPDVQAWVDHGFAVLMPNYRGSTGYGKRWQDALIGDPGRPELVDLRAGRDHLVAQGLAEEGRVVLTGGSWGGYLTLLGVGTQPEAWDCAVAVVPVADYLTAYAEESPELREFDRSLFGGTPDEVGRLFRERSPITHVAAVRAPVLIITGRNDTRCPLGQVENYVEALRAHQIPHRYDVFDAGHGSLAVNEQVRQQILSIDFVAEHLGTPRAQR